MSSALALVNRLSTLDEAVIVEALAIREPKTIGLRDLFDLAESLLVTSSIDRGLARLSRAELTSIANGDSDERLIARCDALLLGDDTDIFSEVTERARHWTTSRDQTARPTFLEVSVMDASEARAAFVEGLTAVAMLDELLAAIARGPLRVNASGALPKASLALLEHVMPRTEVPLHELVSWATQARLVTTRLGNIVVDPTRAAGWNHLSHSERWTWLVTQWLEDLSSGASDLLQTTRWTMADLDEAASHELIVTHAWLVPIIDDALVTARLLGLVRESSTSPVALAVLRDGVTALRTFIDKNAPEETNKVVVQHDLSIIASAPLDATTAARLRSMAHVESRGMASTFRLSADSISRALAMGETGESIRAFLEQASVTPVPQNLIYLINDLGAKHGSVLVSRGASRTTVTAANDQLAGLFSVDSNLRNLQLARIDDLTFETAVEPNAVLSMLVEAGYPAIASESGPRAEVVLDEVRHPALAALVARLRSQGGEIPMDASWLKRQLDLAIRNKESVIVTVAMPDGEREFELEVTALANGRLRGRDVRGSVERTLPLDYVTAVRATG
ncbi:unannotated protein [freshwater metagenome]|uniref:Unannotated protein n=1 Tax=freshwater metagenome TaxID=449393 RepID=A0A6J7FXX6_9ZZZZ